MKNILTIAMIILMLFSITAAAEEQQPETEADGSTASQEILDRATESAKELAAKAQEKGRELASGIMGGYVEKFGSEEEKKAQAKKMLESQYETILGLEKQIDMRVKGTATERQPAAKGFDCTTPKKLHNLIKKNFLTNEQEAAKTWNLYYKNCKNKPGFKAIFDRWEQEFIKTKITLQK